MSATTAKQYLEGLAACGWFEAMPAPLAAALRARVTERFEPEAPWRALEVLELDRECIEEEGDYAALYETFAAASGGVLAAGALSESWKKQAKGRASRVSLSLKTAGKPARRAFTQEDDFAHEKFDELLELALEASGSPLRFVQLPGQPDEVFAFADPSCLAPAAAAGLLPNQAQLAAAAAAAAARRAAALQPGEKVLAWSRCGELLVAGDWRQLFAWRADGAGVARIRHEADRLRLIAALDPTRVVAVSHHGHVLAWNPTTAELRVVVSPPDTWGRLAAVQLDLGLVAMVGGAPNRPPRLSVHALEGGDSRAWELPSVASWVAIAPDGETLWTGHGGGGAPNEAIAWERATGKRLRSLAAEGGGQPFAGAVAPAGAARLALLSSRQVVTVWDLTRAERSSFLGPTDDAQQLLGALAWTPDGATLLGLRSNDGHVHRFDPVTGADRPLRLPPDLSRADEIAAAADGRVAVVWDRVHVLDGSGTVLFELTGLEID